MPDTLILALVLLPLATLGGWLLGCSRAAAPAPIASPPAPPSEAQEAAMLESLCREIGERTAGMVGLSELLLAAPLEDEQLHQAELIAGSGRNLLRLLGDVTDIARIDAGGLQIAPEPTDLRALLDHLASLLRPSASVRRVSLTCLIDESVPETLLLDSSRLRQVLLCLIGNAIKFTEQGTIEVQARMATSNRGSLLAISVVDSGKGIAPELQQGIFQPFYRRSHRSSGASPVPENDGLGLAVASRIMQAMAGAITLESAPGLGSCFTLRLPVALPSDRSPTFVRAPCPADVALSGRRVLVVEDHDLNRDLIQALLQSLGVIPTAVGSGAAAIAANAAAQGTGKPFDLVLMDLHLSGMGGIETTRRLRAAGLDAATLPVVALLTSDRPQDVTACRTAGMQGHLVKPVEIEVLARTMREVLWAKGDADRPYVRPSEAMRPPDHQALHQPRLGDLEGRYRRRKAAFYDALDTTIALSASRAAEADWDTLARQLDQLAGVAASFGEEKLGKLACRLHGEFRAQSSPRKCHDLLARAWGDLQAMR